ncbi:MAG: murein L,D-transpeptidase [Micropepsaceae bacterium]
MLDWVVGVRAWLSGALFLLLAAAPAMAASCDTAGALRGARGSIDAATTRAFYDANGQGCAWDENNAEALTSVLQASGDHGLDPAIFHAAAQGPADEAARDVLLTDGALKYAAAMTRGLTGEPPSKTDRAYSRADGEFVDGLVDALAQGDLTRWLDSLPPRSEPYVQLVEALRMYRAIDAAGGFPVLPDSLVQKSKSKWRNYAPLRQRLALEGDIEADDGSATFDDTLRQGLTRFQDRNGLRADGRMTWKTLERLNIPARQRVAQIALNLERLRVSERETPETRVEVNIPAATAALHRNGQVALSMNVVVGAIGHETPTLTSTIDTVIVNPTWTVPQSIIKNEIMPAIAKNKNYLRKNRMYWAGEQLVQEPGAHNSLGRIKFDFQNRYSVYLHDTPARRHFASPDRAQSHGCVRLERPLDLATLLLEGTERWDRNRIEDAIEAGATRRIAVAEPMPVVITYRTAFVAEDGTVNFRSDVYGWDTKIAAALAQKSAAMGAEPTQW